MSEPTERQLLWVVFAILAVHALLLAALIAIALRVTVISLTLPERAPRQTPPLNSQPSALSFAANPFRGLDPAALGLLVNTTPAPGSGRRERPSRIRATVTRSGFGVRSSSRNPKPKTQNRAAARSA